jgi:hypothetical protein
MLVSWLYLRVCFYVYSVLNRFAYGFFIPKSTAACFNSGHLLERWGWTDGFGLGRDAPRLGRGDGGDDDHRYKDKSTAVLNNTRSHVYEDVIAQALVNAVGSRHGIGYSEGGQPSTVLEDVVKKAAKETVKKQTSFQFRKRKVDKDIDSDPSSDTCGFGPPPNSNSGSWCSIGLAPEYERPVYFKDPRHDRSYIASFKLEGGEGLACKGGEGEGRDMSFIDVKTGKKVNSAMNK